MDNYDSYDFGNLDGTPQGSYDYYGNVISSNDYYGGNYDFMGGNPDSSNYQETPTPSYDSYNYQDSPSQSYNYTGTNSLDGMFDNNYDSYDYQGTNPITDMTNYDSYDYQGKNSLTSPETPEEKSRRFRSMAGRVAGAIPGPLGMMAKAGMAATSPNPSAAFGKMGGNIIGGLLGNAILPGLGGIAGGFLGDLFGGSDSPTNSGTSGTNNGTSPQGQGVSNTNNPYGAANGMSLEPGRLGMGLAGIYQGQQQAGNIRQAVNSNKQQQEFAAQQAASLASMYGPNSPYADQLRQQLERKDAAGGRRSQYGPREVELQAKLAGMASGIAPNILAANKQAMDGTQQGLNYQTQGTKVQGQQIGQVGSIADMINKSGILKDAAGGLRGIFNNPPAPQPIEPNQNESQADDFWKNWLN